MDRPPFTVPTNVLVDPESGYAINMPLGPQDYPGWQEDKPEVVKRIHELRKTWQVHVEDDEFSDRVRLTATTPSSGNNRGARPKPKRRR